MLVLKTAEEDGVATLTIAPTGEKPVHKFEVWEADGTALVEYQESLTYRGEIEVSEPDADVFKALATSREMTEFLNEHGCESVRRAAPRA